MLQCIRKQNHNGGFLLPPPSSYHEQQPLQVLLAMQPNCRHPHAHTSTHTDGQTDKQTHKHSSIHTQRHAHSCMHLCTLTVYESICMLVHAHGLCLYASACNLRSCTRIRACVPGMRTSRQIGRMHAKFMLPRMHACLKACR